MPGTERDIPDASACNFAPASQGERRPSGKTNECFAPLHQRDTKRAPWFQCLCDGNLATPSFPQRERPSSPSPAGRIERGGIQTEITPLNLALDVNSESTSSDETGNATAGISANLSQVPVDEEREKFFRKKANRWSQWTNEDTGPTEELMKRQVRTMIHALNNDESNSESWCERQRQLLTSNILMADTSDKTSTTREQRHPSRDQYNTGVNSNFCATGQTGRWESNEATPREHGLELHVAVMYDMDEDAAVLASSQSTNSSLDAPNDAPTVESLRIPYRSMTAKLGVVTHYGNTINTTPCEETLRCIVDSGAAQTAVSQRWLIKHPDLWNRRIQATHRFHGITGEPLQTNGVVALTLNLGGHYINVWAHVFVHMKSDLLLGTSSIFENALVIDGGDCQLYSKRSPKQTVDLSYRLTDNNSVLSVLGNDETVHSVPLQIKKLKPIMQQSIAHFAANDIVIHPTSQVRGEGEEERQALLLTTNSPFTGAAHDRRLQASREFSEAYPHLEVIDAVYNTSQNRTYMVVANHSSEATTIPAGTRVADSVRFDSSKMLTSNEEGHGRLTFEVQPPKQEKKSRVTEADLLERGVDLSNCRDLGLPGAPLLSAEQHSNILQICVEEEETFTVDPKRPGTSDWMLIRLNTSGPPQASKPYSIPYQYQELVREEVLKLLRYGLISPINSSWASPILVIVKKDHTSETANIKLATDLRKLNAVTEMDAGSIGEMSEIVDKFNGKPYASCCDLASGYYNFLIHPEDRHKLAFVLPMPVSGSTTFCWNRAPYGVALLPAQFSRAIMTIQKGLHDDLTCYIDDLTCHTSTFERHCYAIKQMCRRLRMAGLQLKGSKCLFLPPQLELLGFMITPGGVQMQAKKCQEWIKFPTPSNRKELQAFLGGVAWYRRWMDGLGTMTVPLNDLLKKGVKWEWGEKQEAAFQAIKELLGSEELMAFPDFTDPKAEYWVFTDASDVAIAGILMQLQWDASTHNYRPRVIAHYSKVLNDTQRRWAIYEKESAALMLSVTHWRKYLLGRKFTTFVDSTVALTMLSKQRHPSKMQRWGLLLQEYLPGMSIGFKRGTENPADVHSRAATFAKFVPQPEHELALDDSLFERVYQVPTRLRGTFELSIPKQPFSLDTLWNVSGEERPDEVVAAVFPEEDPMLAAAHERQLGYVRNYLARKSLIPSSSTLTELEAFICTNCFDPVTRVRTASERKHMELVDHYSQYVDAFKKMEGRVPRILCYGGNDQLFHAGVQIAGCEVAILATDDCAPEADSGTHVIQDQPGSSSPLDVQGIHAYDCKLPTCIAASCVLDRVLYPDRTVIPVQVDNKDTISAINFALHQPSLGRTAGELDQSMHALAEQVNNHVNASDHAEQSRPLECAIAAPSNTSSSVMHGQLLAGQMVAQYMCNAYGMPLWSHADAQADPSKLYTLKEWAEHGYLMAFADDEADSICEALEQADVGCERPVRILMREGEPPQPPRKPSQVPMQPTLGERQARYELARARIFAGINNSDAADRSDDVPETERDDNAAPAGKLPEDQHFSEITLRDQEQDALLQSLRSTLQQEIAQDSSQSNAIKAVKKHFFIDSSGLLKQRALRHLPLHNDVQEVERVVVPQHRRHGLLHAYHTMPTTGHRGHQVLYQAVSQRYYWNGMYSDCVDFVSRCEVCGTRRPLRARYAREARLTQTPPRPFHSLGLDIKGPLPTTTNGNTYILVVVCLLTRFVIAIALPNVDSSTIARALVDHVFSIHGAPYNMQMDNASYFTSTLMQKLTELYGIKHITVLPYQPTANGTSEAMVKRISYALQRHSNALRRWDAPLSMLVHGLNTVEVNELGETPFYSVFGRDAVGIAELAWPDLQKLDVDGSDFVRSLAALLREIWSNLKQASDEKKRKDMVKANEQRSKAEPEPLQVGDYVWVEYGDDQHSRRLGKAGLPRRRRFKVIGYYPERGYVEIDTDGLRILNKVSLSRVSKAPKTFSVEDRAQPMTKIEKKGHENMPYPPGWQQLIKRGANKDQVIYVGPGGNGRAHSVLEAWRKFNSDPTLMPQPKATTVAHQALPVVTRNAPPSPAPTTSRSTTLPQPLHLPGQKITQSRANTLVSRLSKLYFMARVTREVRFGYTLSIDKDPVTNAISWRVQSHHGQQVSTARELAAMLGWPIDTFAMIPCDDEAEEPAVGSRIKVYWSDERRWYTAVVRHKCREIGQLLHMVRYDLDGSDYWHDMSDDDNKWDYDTAATGPSLAHIYLADAIARIQDTRDRKTARKAAYKSHSLMSLVWVEDGEPIPTFGSEYPSDDEGDGPPFVGGLASFDDDDARPQMRRPRWPPGTYYRLTATGRINSWVCRRWKPRIRIEFVSFDIQSRSTTSPDVFERGELVLPTPTMQPWNYDFMWNLSTAAFVTFHRYVRYSPPALTASPLFLHPLRRIYHPGFAWQRGISGVGNVVSWENPEIASTPGPIIVQVHLTHGRQPPLPFITELVPSMRRLLTFRTHQLQWIKREIIRDYGLDGYHDVRQAGEFFKHMAVECGVQGDDTSFAEIQRMYSGLLHTYGDLDSWLHHLWITWHGHRNPAGAGADTETIASAHTHWHTDSTYTDTLFANDSDHPLHWFSIEQVRSITCINTGTYTDVFFMRFAKHYRLTQQYLIWVERSLQILGPTDAPHFRASAEALADFDLLMRNLKTHSWINRDRAVLHGHLTRGLRIIHPYAVILAADAEERYQLLRRQVIEARIQYVLRWAIIWQSRQCEHHQYPHVPMWSTKALESIFVPKEAMRRQQHWHMLRHRRRKIERSRRRMRRIARIRHVVGRIRQGGIDFWNPPIDLQASFWNLDTYMSTRHLSRIPSHLVRLEVELLRHDGIIATVSDYCDVSVLTNTATTTSNPPQALYYYGLQLKPESTNQGRATMDLDRDGRPNHDAMAEQQMQGMTWTDETVPRISTTMVDKKEISSSMGDGPHSLPGQHELFAAPTLQNGPGKFRPRIKVKFIESSSATLPQTSELSLHRSDFEHYKHFDISHQHDLAPKSLYHPGFGWRDEIAPPYYESCQRLSSARPVALPEPILLYVSSTCTLPRLECESLPFKLRAYCKPPHGSAMAWKCAAAWLMDLHHKIHVPTDEPIPDYGVFTGWRALEFYLIGIWHDWFAYRHGTLLEPHCPLEWWRDTGYDLHSQNNPSGFGYYATIGDELRPIRALDLELFPGPTNPEDPRYWMTPHQIQRHLRFTNSAAQCLHEFEKQYRLSHQFLQWVETSIKLLGPEDDFRFQDNDNLYFLTGDEEWYNSQLALTIEKYEPDALELGVDTRALRVRALHLVADGLKHMLPHALLKAADVEERYQRLQQVIQLRRNERVLRWTIVWKHRYTAPTPPPSPPGSPLPWADENVQSPPDFGSEFSSDDEGDGPTPRLPDQHNLFPAMRYRDGFDEPRQQTLQNGPGRYRARVRVQEVDSLDGIAESPTDGLVTTSMVEIDMLPEPDTRVAAPAEPVATLPPARTVNTSKSHKRRRADSDNEDGDGPPVVETPFGPRRYPGYCSSFWLPRRVSVVFVASEAQLHGGTTNQPRYREFVSHRAWGIVDIDRAWDGPHYGDNSFRIQTRDPMCAVYHPGFAFEPWITEIDDASSVQFTYNNEGQRHGYATIELRVVRGRVPPIIQPYQRLFEPMVWAAPTPLDRHHLLPPLDPLNLNTDDDTANWLAARTYINDIAKVAANRCQEAIQPHHILIRASTDHVNNAAWHKLATEHPDDASPWHNLIFDTPPCVMFRNNADDPRYWLSVAQIEGCLRLDWPEHALQRYDGLPRHTMSGAIMNRHRPLNTDDMTNALLIRFDLHYRVVQDFLKMVEYGLQQYGSMTLKRYEPNAFTPMFHDDDARTLHYAPMYEHLLHGHSVPPIADPGDNITELRRQAIVRTHRGLQLMLPTAAIYAADAEERLRRIETLTADVRNSRIIRFARSVLENIMTTGNSEPSSSANA